MAHKEISAVSHKRRYTKLLNSPGTKDNLGTPDVLAAEQVDVAGSRASGALHGDRVLNHGDSVVNLLAAVTRVEATKRVACVLDTALANEPPGGLGTGDSDDDEGNRPEPLETVGNLGRSVLHSL